MFFKKKQPCFKCETPTKLIFEKKPTCGTCKIEILTSREDVVLCPKDGQKMEKVVLEDSEIIIDRCPVCKGVWLDPDELEMLKDSSTNSNLATGICLGIAIG
ncbi:zf-TFIIB domain-containing protein [Vibrio vulnificus]|uniref:TFIIB-type zinc ribbon-containing protein n=1 Tax=Vibrio vulnificus TaxID=672 RepID=UPI0005F1AF16|nr:zf-TFIIB domain-containing protein [Vibrio vulnificus]TBT51332.1 hypothetical protein D5E78_05935 [Vibrio parahaemolyticus]